MRILLVRPRWPYPVGYGESTYNRIWPPLSLANCAALLTKAGFDVAVVDAHALRLSPGQVARRAEGADGVFVTSSSLDRWQCPNSNLTPVVETVRALVSRTDEVYVIGFHGTVAPGRSI